MMATKHRRRLAGWVHFYHPRTGQLIHEGLDIYDEARVALMHQRIGFQAALFAPRFQSADMPVAIKLPSAYPLALWIRRWSDQFIQSQQGNRTHDDHRAPSAAQWIAELDSLFLCRRVHRRMDDRRTPRGSFLRERV